MPLATIKITPLYPAQVDTIFVDVYLSRIGVIIGYQTRNYTLDDVKGYVEAFINKAPAIIERYKNLGDIKGAEATCTVLNKHKFVLDAWDKLPASITYVDTNVN